MKRQSSCQLLQKEKLGSTILTEGQYIEKSLNTEILEKSEK
jgi:hypothetical protein